MNCKVIRDTYEGDICRGSAPRIIDVYASAFFNDLIYRHLFQAPMQDNTYDCGLFTFYYAESFFGAEEKFITALKVSPLSIDIILS